MSFSCQKEEGSGGSSDIEGIVYIEERNAFTNAIESTYAAQEERIYLQYGDNDIYSEDTRTDYKGNFRFEELQNGTYVVFVYEDCILCPSGKSPVFDTIEVAKQNRNFSLSDTIRIDKYN